MNFCCSESVGHQAPQSVGPQASNSVGPQAPNSVGHQAPNNVGHQAPNNVGRQAPNNVGHQAPNNVGHQAPNSVGHQSPKIANSKQQALGHSRVPLTLNESSKAHDIENVDFEKQEDLEIDGSESLHPVCLRESARDDHSVGLDQNSASDGAIPSARQLLPDITRIRGVKNVGNSCYVSSGLQGLS